MPLIVLSFFAGILTVLAPCVFSLLPIILGKSASSTSKWRPYIITASLAISLALFTFLLKISTVFLNVSPDFWKYASGILILALGLVTLFPATWDKISIKLKLSSNSDKLLEKAESKDGFWGDVLTGAALGPVFSSCSPTYAFVLSSTLQGSIAEGVTNIFAYILGLSLIMLAIGLLGQRLVKRMRWMANPDGLFKKIIGILFILVGLLIITGFDKKLEVAYVEIDPFQTIKLEQKLIDDSRGKNSLITETDSLGFNINPPVKAPEIVGIDKWINSDVQTISGLKGKVVLVDFWTYSCINCQRTLPYLTKWYDTYKDDGFVILGLHAPEFAFEQKIENVQKYVNEDNIKYPVGLDNDFATWKNYNNRAWPAKYLIDREGNIRYFHEGEGDYDLTEKLIRNLLEENGAKLDTKLVSDEVKNDDGFMPNQTPETYLGWSRSEKFANYPELNQNQAFNKSYTYTKTELKSNHWGLEGSWTINNENIISNSATSKLRLKFSARNVYLVAGTDSKESKVGVAFYQNGQLIDGAKLRGSDVDSNGQWTIKEDTLFTIVQADKFYEDLEVELTVPAGVRFNAFTFGS